MKNGVFHVTFLKHIYLRMKQFKDKFNYIDKCNMCNSPISNHKVLGKRLNQSQGKSPKNKTGIAVTVCQCTNCGLIYSNPQPIPFNIQDHYGIPPEDYWKKEYFTIGKGYVAGSTLKAKRLIDFKEGMKSLDIGAGLGKTMTVLANAGFDSYGLEPSQPFYEKIIERTGIDSDKLKLGGIEDVEYAENYFDFITFGAVLEHLYDPSDSIIKALRWLKPNGVLHIELTSYKWLINKISN
jgi:hypothetical protein